MGDDFRRGLERNGSTEARGLYGWTMWEIGRYDKSLSATQELIALEPTTALNEAYKVLRDPVRRALEVIEDHYPEPLTITDLAAASHISVRRLQAGFRRRRAIARRDDDAAPRSPVEPPPAHGAPRFAGKVAVLRSRGVQLGGALQLGGAVVEDDLCSSGPGRLDLHRRRVGGHGGRHLAGHIPGALNRPSAENMGTDGKFKPAAQLKAEFEELLAGRDPATVVHHCGSGVSALPNLLAMEIAGLGHSALYAGSWSEWCSDPRRPVEKG